MPPDAATGPWLARERPPAAARLPLASLWRTRSYLRGYYGQLAFMLAATLAATGTEIVIPLLTKAAIDGPIAAAARHPAAAPHARGLLVPIGLAALALGVTQVVLNLIRRWVQAAAVCDAERRMRDDLYAHLQRLEPAFHDSWQSGQLLSRATTDLSAIRRFAGFGTIFMITSVVSFAVVITLLVRLNTALGLLTALVFVPVTALCARFEGRYRVLSRRVQDEQDVLATHVEEAAAGIRILRALGRGETAAAAHRELATAVYRTQAAKARLRGTFWASLDLLPNAVIALLLLLGAVAVSHAQLSRGGLVAFITLTLALVWPIVAMGYILALGQEAATAAQRYYEIMDTVPAITDRTAAGGPATPMARPPRAPAGRLSLRGVGYRYPGAPAPVLRDVTLEVAPGETVALVGATGAGKTTVLQLIARLTEVSAGSIRLDGTDIRDLPLAVLRGRIGCAFEDPTLFSASVRENVSLGAPESSDTAIEAALAAAQAGFVHQLPWGLDTRIGEQGMSLSGGQRQRIALARAILARPVVLVLDDPLSALDVHTEAKVTAALHEVLTACTALIVAHRPSTVALADRVAVLDRGVITATGAHHDLLARDPHYRYLMRPPDGDGRSGTGHDLTGART
jgi:ATP-binding cassette subfamily B protein